MTKLNFNNCKIDLNEEKAAKIGVWLHTLIDSEKCPSDIKNDLQRVANLLMQSVCNFDIEFSFNWEEFKKKRFNV